MSYQKLRPTLGLVLSSFIALSTLSTLPAFSDNDAVPTTRKPATLSAQSSHWAAGGPHKMHQHMMHERMEHKMHGAGMCHEMAMHHHHHGFFLPPGLKLADDQLEKIMLAEHQFEDKSAPLKAQMGIHKRAMMDLMTQASIDREKVRQVQAQINSDRATMSGLRNDAAFAISDVLTPEQHKRIRDMYVRHEVGVPMFHHEHHEEAPAASEEPTILTPES